MALLRWLLGLSDDRWLESGRLALRFATPPAPWIMLAGAVLAALLLHIVLRRESLTPKRRHVLYALRLSSILLVLFILGQPMLVLRRTHVDRSRVAMLVDRSYSMSIRDERSADPSKTVRRWDAVIEALADPGRGLIGRLLEHHDVDLWTYADTATPVMTVTRDSSLHELRDRLRMMEPSSPETNLSSAIETVMERMRGVPLSAVIVAGDGRETRVATAESALSRTPSRSAAFHAIGAGAAEKVRDVELTAAECEEDVFVRDSVVIRVTTRLHGYENMKGCELQVRDKRTGELLASRRLANGATLVSDSPDQAKAADGPASNVGVATYEEDVIYRPTTAGSRVLVVSVTPRDDEANLDNNAAEVVVSARDEKIGVLYVEGTPRFEYRYLKNMLLREPGIESSCLLLSATPAFPQEGTRPIRQFPRSVEELRAYDVIVFGDVDVRGDWLSPMQQLMVNDHVMLHGAGIVFLAGQRHMPNSLRQTPLEKLLPVVLPPADAIRDAAPMTESFSPRVTAAGRRSGLFRFDEGVNGDEDWPGSAASFYWSVDVTGVRPASEILAARPSWPVDQEPVPLVVLGRVGAGRTFFLGSDDAWRIRQTAGEPAYEAFWLRVLRTLARGRKLGNDCGRRLIVDQRNVELGRAVRVEMIDENPLGAPITREMSVSITDAVRGLIGTLPLKPMAGATSRWEGYYEPTEPGHYQLSVPAAETLTNCRRPAARVSFHVPDRERRESEADHEYLRTLAARTGGTFRRLVQSTEDLLAAIPDRSVQVPDDVEETLWDKPIMLVMFASQMIAEWIIRKRLGLA